MPKPTFFRLADEKRNRLIKAAYDEFARAPFAQASISNIIKEAGIPRGSFYQYFEDKSDIYFYLLDQLHERSLKLMKTTLDQHKGDFFASMAEAFDRIIDELIDGQYAAFYRNLFMYMDFHSADRFSQPKPPDHPAKGKSKVTKYLLEHVDRKPLRLTADDELIALVRTVSGLFLQTIGYYYNQQAKGVMLSKIELKKRIALLLDWMQYGVVNQ